MSDLFGFGSEVLRRMDRIQLSLDAIETRLAGKQMAKAQQTGSAPKSVRLVKPKTDRKNRISENMFKAKAPLFIEELLNGKSVGKMVKSLVGPLETSEDTVTRVARRLADETDFVIITPPQGGHGMYFRLTDEQKAREWLRAKTPS